MRLVKKGENEQNAYYAWVRDCSNQLCGSWKDLSNSKTIVVSKSVQNSLPTNIKNATTNCGFIANPIKHPRKQYVNLDGTTSGFSRQSYIGSLDKPGSENITSVDCATLHQSGNRYLIDMSVPCDTSRCFVMKPATTVINSEYSHSHKALLYKRCKTLNQNSLTTANTNLSASETTVDCSLNNCRPIFVPSNTRYRVQGPLSSSARTAALRYCTQDGDDSRAYAPPGSGHKYSQTTGSYSQERPFQSKKCYLPHESNSLYSKVANGLGQVELLCNRRSVAGDKNALGERYVRPGNKTFGINLITAGMA